MNIYVVVDYAADSKEEFVVYLSMSRAGAEEFIANEEPNEDFEIQEWVVKEGD